MGIYGKLISLKFDKKLEHSRDEIGHSTDIYICDAYHYILKYIDHGDAELRTRFH